MRSGSGVGVLALDELERQNALVDQLLAQHQPVAVGKKAVDAGGGGIAVDFLGRVGVEHPRVDVGAVGQLGRVSGQDAGHVSGNGWIGGQRGALIGERHQHVAINHSARALLAAGEREEGVSPQRAGQVRAVVVLAGRLDAAHLKERAGAEDAVEVRFEETAVNPQPAAGLDVDGAGGLVPVLGAVVAAVGGELGNDGGGGAQARVEIAQQVPVHQVELDVLVAAALAGAGVGLPQEIEVGALLHRRRGRGCVAGRVLIRWCGP